MLRVHPDNLPGRAHWQCGGSALAKRPTTRLRHRSTPRQNAANSNTDEEEPFWFVKKYEERRKALENAKNVDAAQQTPAAAAPAATASPDPPPPQPDPPRAPPPPPNPEWTRAAALHSAALAAALAALILWPASFHAGGLLEPRVWLLFFAYLAFFAGGSVRRILTFGPLASADSDQQRATASSRLWLAAFILAMPLLHWLPLRRYLMIAAAAGALGGLTLYDLVGWGLIGAGAVLNFRAAAALGSAYDRVVAPKQLVTTGPYSLVQVGERLCGGLAPTCRLTAAHATLQSVNHTNFPIPNNPDPVF